MTRGTRETERFTLRGTLAACVVDGVVGVVLPGQDQLGDGHKGVALLDQGLQDSGQSFRRMQCGIVKENDGTWLDLFRHPLHDLIRRDLLPVQAVHVPLDGFHTDGAHRPDGVVVVVPIREADQGGARAGDRLDFVVAGV